MSSPSPPRLRSRKLPLTAASERLRERLRGRPGRPPRLGPGHVSGTSGASACVNGGGEGRAPDSPSCGPVPPRLLDLPAAAHYLGNL